MNTFLLKTKHLFFAVGILLSVNVFSQAPNKISFQAVVRNGNNALVTSANVSLRISLLQGAASGAVVYSETHTATTNANGLATLQIGAGTVLSGSFAGIDWANGPYFIKTETDPNGGSNYGIVSVTQLLSVPYALYAQTSGSSTPGPQGPAGANGNNGLSAYEIWLQQGNTGTQTDYLNSITGPQGATGVQGPAGVNGTNGIDGKNTLVKTTPEAVGANCATGGTKIEVGLDANGNGILDAVEVNASLTRYVCNGTDGVLNAWGLNGNSGTNPTSNFIGTTDVQDFVLRTNNTEKMRVTAGGNIGIGTINPNTKLDIQNSINNFSDLLSISNLNNGSSATTSLKISNTNSPFQFGKLGISTINWPGYGTAGDAYIYNGLLGKNLNIIAADPSFGNINFYPGRVANQKSVLSLNVNSNVGIGTSNPLGKFHVNNDASGADSSFVVTTDGNVGIGTSSPMFKITSVDNGLYYPFGVTDNGGNIRFRVDFEGDQTYNYTNFKFDIFPLDNTSQAQFRFFRSTNTTGPKTIVFFRGNNTTQTSAQIGVDGLNSYFQIHGGNFGIGTSSPLGKLHVSNDVSGADSSFVVTTDGKVGVGSTAPTSKLEVNGAATNTTALNAGTGTTINFASSNLAYTSATGTAITLQNIKDGGAYTLIFTSTGATGTATFTATGFTFVEMGTIARTNGKKHIYSFIVVGTEVYVTMATQN